MFAHGREALLLTDASTHLGSGSYADNPWHRNGMDGQAATPGNVLEQLLLILLPRSEVCGFKAKSPVLFE